MTKTKRRNKGLSNHRTAKRAKNKDSKNDEEDEITAITSRLFGSVDIASVIFSFLEVRPLLRFVSLSKIFSTRLSYKNVILAAMMSGRNGSMTIENLLQPLRDRTIWIPSPMRLLRLVCGKQCELCRRNRIHYIAPTFGIFLCQRKCMNEYTGSLRKSKKWNPYRDHHRVARGRRNGSVNARGLRWFMFSKPLKDKTGERIGPLLTIEDMLKLEEENIDGLSAEDKVNNWMSECDSLQPDADRMLQNIFQAVEESKKESAILLEGRKEEKKAARKQRMENRKQQVDSLLVQLDALLSSDVAWKHRLAGRKWSTSDGRYNFEDPVLDKVVGDALLAPSKMKKSKLPALVDKVQSVHDDRVLMDQYIQTIISKVDSERVQDAMSRKWNKQWCHYDFDDWFVSSIVSAPLLKPKSLKPRDLENLAKRVTAHLKNKEKSDELLEILRKKVQGIARYLDQRCWKVETARYEFYCAGIDATIGKDFEKPFEITNSRLEKLSRELERKLLTTGVHF